MVPNIVLMDIDNTLANMDHRLHYFDRSEMDWDEFENQAAYDLPIVPTIQIAQRLRSAGCLIWCWSGRTTRIEGVTKLWLKKNCVPCDQLLLRSPELAKVESAEATKLRWLTEGPIPRDRVICGFDDDPKVIAVLRDKGGLLMMRVVRPLDGSDSK